MSDALAARRREFGPEGKTIREIFLSGEFVPRMPESKDRDGHLGVMGAQGLDATPIHHPGKVHRGAQLPPPEDPFAEVDRVCREFDVCLQRGAHAAAIRPGRGSLSTRTSATAATPNPQRIGTRVQRPNPSLPGHSGTR